MNVVEIQTKVCITCKGDAQPVGNFYRSSHGSGRQSRCKRCDNSVRAYGIAETERRLARGEALPQPTPRGSVKRTTKWSTRKALGLPERSRTIPMKHVPRRVIEMGRLLFPAAEIAANQASRPKTRGDCQSVVRPCPYVSCRHNLYLDIQQDTGALKLNYPTVEVDEMIHSCSLDIAGKGGATLEDVAITANLTRERIRQIEFKALRRIKRLERLGVQRLTEFVEDDGKMHLRLVRQHSGQRGSGLQLRGGGEPEQEHAPEEVEEIPDRSPSFFDMPAQMGDGLLGDMGILEVEDDSEFSRWAWRVYLRDSAEHGFAPRGDHAANADQWLSDIESRIESSSSTEQIMQGSLTDRLVSTLEKHPGIGVEALASKCKSTKASVGIYLSRLSKKGLVRSEGSGPEPRKWFTGKKTNGVHKASNGVAPVAEIAKEPWISKDAVEARAKLPLNEGGAIEEMLEEKIERLVEEKAKIEREIVKAKAGLKAMRVA